MLIDARNFSDTCDIVLCPNFKTEKNIHIDNPTRIFVSGEQFYFERTLNYLKSFKNKYELIYHCSDSPFDYFKFQSIRKYVTHIYAENCEIKHPMITQLPLGFNQEHETPSRMNIPFENRSVLCYLNVGLYNDELQFVKCKNIRQDCIDFFKTKSFVKIESGIKRDEFFKTLNNTKFVLCPPGYGIDTFRFYEASYLGCVPIVLKSGLDDMYKKFNPIIVDTWEEITEELLASHQYIKPCEELFKVETYIKV